MGVPALGAALSRGREVYPAAGTEGKALLRDLVCRATRISPNVIYTVGWTWVHTFRLISMGFEEMQRAGVESRGLASRREG